MQRSYLILAAFLAGGFFHAGAAQSAERAKISGTLAITDGGSWRSAGKGVEQRKIALVRSEPNYSLEFILLRFDAKAIEARVLTGDNLQAQSATAQSFAEMSGALAAINANYFDERGRPLAYVKSSGKEINRAVSKHALYTGVFAVIDGQPAVMHRDDFVPAQARDALQSGPLLLNRGAPVETMRGLSRYARRSVVGIDKERRIVIGVTDAIRGGLSFVELQELFTNAKWRLNTPELLNLDGGGSAQLYFKSGKFAESVAGTSEVPVAIGFFAKTN